MPYLANPCTVAALALESTDCDTDREVMTELMQLWDGLSSSGQDRVVVLAATNRPWDLDPAIQVHWLMTLLRVTQPRLPSMSGPAIGVSYEPGRGTNIYLTPDFVLCVPYLPASFL